MGSSGASQRAGVLAVLVCHEGRTWLPDTLAALGALTVRPDHAIAVVTGSADRSAEVLAAAPGLDAVLELPAATGFGDAVRAALAAADARFGGPDPWIWLLHDDSAPEPDCLRALLAAAELSPTAALLGPLCLDWEDPRRVVEAGLSTDASGHRQTGLGPEELDLGQFAQHSEVLAVGSAGSLIRREVWDALGGYDPALPMLRDDLDFGWRVNRAGHLVMCVPAARLRHVVAAGRRRRAPEAAGGRYRAVDRRHGLRTFLVNCSSAAFLLGLVRLPLLCLLRAGGFLLLRRARAARAELAALGHLLRGKAGLRAARRLRRPAVSASSRAVRGLLTRRRTRLRNLVRGGLARLLRSRLGADLALGRLPAPARPAPPAPTPPAGRAELPDALPTAAAAGGSRVRRVAGLRPPTRAVAAAAVGRPADLVVLPIGRRRLARELLLAPPLLLVAGLLALSLAVQHARLGLALSGGRLLPPQGFAATWGSYLAEWHQVDGGTAAPAPAALAVLGALGAPFVPVGGPVAAVSVLLLAALPLAGLTGYLATRRMRVSPWARAAAAAGYALNPVLAAAVAQGRLDVVVAVVLLPLVIAGMVAVLRGPPPEATPGAWLPAACLTALALAVVSAFAPLVHLMVLVAALAGFVLTPARPGYALRRTLALFVVVLLPIGLLLPWPAVVLAHPGVLLHGVGASLPEPPVTVSELFTLDPGGPGSVPALGALLLAAAVLVTAARRRPAALPGLALAALGIGAAAVVTHLRLPPLAGGPPQPGWTGAPLAVAACGALWAVLGGLAPPAERASGQPRARAPGRLVPVGIAVAVVAGLAAGVALRGGAGPLTARQTPRLDAALATDLERAGTAVAELALDGRVRSAGARLPRFGDDDLAPVGTESQRLERDVTVLRAGQPPTARAAVADLAVGGVALLVVPDADTAARMRAAAGAVLADDAPTSDGRPTLRVRVPAAGAVLLEPPLSGDARSPNGRPPQTPNAPGVATIPDQPPEVAVRVSAGAPDRLLVVAAADEPGWLASVNGAGVRVVLAWGHLVGVPVGPAQSEVRVERSGALRALLLLLEVALLLFTVLTALPARHRSGED